MALFGDETQEFLAQIEGGEVILGHVSRREEKTSAVQEESSLSVSSGKLEQEFAHIAKGVLEHAMKRFTENLEQVVHDALRGHVRHSATAPPSAGVRFQNHSAGEESDTAAEEEDHEWMQRPWFSHFYVGPARQLPPDELTALGTPKQAASKNLSLFHRPTLPDRPSRKKRKGQGRFNTNETASDNFGSNLSLQEEDRAHTAEPSFLVHSSLASSPLSQQAHSDSAPDLTLALEGFTAPSAPRGGAGQKKIGVAFEELPHASLATPSSGVAEDAETTMLILQDSVTEDDLGSSTAESPVRKRRSKGLTVFVDEDSAPASGPPTVVCTPASRQMTEVTTPFPDSASSTITSKDKESPLFSTYKPRSSAVLSETYARTSESFRPGTGGIRPASAGARPTSGGKPSTTVDVSDISEVPRALSAPSTLKDRFERLTKGRAHSFKLETPELFTPAEEELPPSLRSGPSARQRSERASGVSIRNFRPGGAMVKSMVQSGWFDFLMALVVVASAVLVGVRADRGIRNVEEPEPVGFENAELAFCVIFALEIVLRVYTYRCDFFWYSPDRLWNWFDTAIVVFQILTEVLERATARNDFEITVLYMRMLRILRYIRIVRFVRVVHFIHQLRTMVASVAATLRSLCWTLVLIACLIYTVGVLLTQVIIEYARDDSDLLQEGRPLHTFYGSLARVLLSLYQAFTGGVDWDNLVSPLTDDLSPVFAGLFALYIGFAVLAMLNVITGVFVESALTNTKIQDDIELVNNMRELFKSIDFADAGQITWDQFKCQLAKPGMELYFKAIDLDVSEARGLFKLLDLDNSGSITVDEFVMGCLRLRGPAKAIDLATLMYDNRRILQRWRNHAASMQRTLNSIAVALGVQHRC